MLLNRIVRITLLTLSLFIVFGCSKSEQEETESPPVLSGYLYGSNGTAMKYAVVTVESLTGATKDDIVKIPVSENGQYSLALTKHQRYLITYAGVTHIPMSLVVNYTGQQNLKMNVELDRVSYLADPTKVNVRIYTNVVAGKDKPKKYPMNKTDDGHFSASIDLPAGKIKYRLSGLTAGRHRVVNENADDFELGKSNSIYSIEDHQGGMWSIDYKVPDPRKNKAASPLTLSGDWQKQNNMLQIQAKFYRLLIDQRLAAIKAKDADFVFQEGLDELKEWLTQYKDPQLQSLLLIMSTRLIGQIPEVHDKAINEIDANSWLWDLPYASYVRSITGSGVNNGSEEDFVVSIRQLELYKKLSDSYLEVSFNDDEKANLLLELAYSYRQNNQLDKYNYYFEQLKSKYSHVENFSFYKKILSPSKLLKGMSAPLFSIKDLQKDNVVYTNQSFIGNVYLLDFWATWCTPCLKEMPNLHDTYNKFKDKGFEILSLSADTNVSDVIEYRKGKWTMPWKHAFLEDGKHPIMKSYFIFGFPTLFLIDEQGKVLASGSQATGSGLAETLEKYYDSKNTEIESDTST